MRISVFVCVCVYFSVCVCLCLYFSVCVYPQGWGSVHPVFPFALTDKCWDYLGNCFLRMP